MFTGSTQCYVLYIATLSSVYVHDSTYTGNGEYDKCTYSDDNFLSFHRSVVILLLVNSFSEYACHTDDRIGYKAGVDGCSMRNHSTYSIHVHYEHCISCHCTWTHSLHVRVRLFQYLPCLLRYGAYKHLCQQGHRK